MPECLIGNRGPKCHKPFYRSFDSSKDCKVVHSPYRQDVSIQYVSILTRAISLSIDDKFRTVHYYYSLRMVIKLTKVNFYLFVSGCIAFSGAITLVISLYKKFVTSKIKKKLDNLEEVVILGEAVADQNLTENIPLLNLVRNTDKEESTPSSGNSFNLKIT